VLNFSKLFAKNWHKMGGEAGASLEIIMITRKTMPAVGVLALLAASPFASAQTINVAGPFDFVDTLVGPEAGSNSVATGVGTVGSAYTLGSSVTVNSVNLTSVIASTYASEASVQVVNSGYPAMAASFNFSATATYTTVSISSPTVRPLANNTIGNANIAAGSTWDLTFYESFSDGTGPDSTGDTLSFSPDVYVAPPPAAQTITAAGPFDFVDTLTGPEAGSNSVVTGVGVVPSAYVFGASALVNSINLTSVLAGTYASEATIQMVNSGYPGLSAHLKPFTTTGFSTLAISTPTQVSFYLSTLSGANIAAGSTWDLTFYETFSDGTGTDSTGDTLSFGPYAGPVIEQGNWETFEPLVDGTIYTGVTGGFTADHDWTYQNNSPAIGSTSWFTGNTAVFGAQQGAHYLAANFNSCTGAGLIDNWLISEEKAWDNGDVVSFYARTAAGSIWPDRVHLKLSTNGASTNVGDFTTVLASVNPALTTGGFPEAWTKFSGTISGLSGTTMGRIAFHYDVTDGGPAGSNSNYFGIDDVSISVPLTGNLILGDTAFSGASTRDIAYTVMQGTVTLSSGTVTATASSSAMSILVPKSATGAAELVLDGSSFLKRKVALTLTGSSQAIGNATMQNGDVDGTGEVDAADIDQVIAAFGNMGDNVEDVDVSDEVDAADIDIVIANFGGMDD